MNDYFYSFEMLMLMATKVMQSSEEILPFCDVLTSISNEENQ
jgi:hypothetical protein